METLPFSPATSSQLPLPIPPTQKCRCVSSIHQRWRARSQSELGSHHLLASLPPPAVVFPQDLLEKGLEADNFAMLGLGDIVIPGIFIALLLRFDISLKKNTHTYFYTSFAAYIFGLGLTIFIMHIFKHAQPALLYLVPACIGFPVLVALAKGEVTEMFSYESSAEILPHTPRLTHFPTVSGSPASLADSMQQKLAGPRRRRPQNPSAIGRFKKLKIGLHKPKSNLSRLPLPLPPLGTTRHRESGAGSLSEEGAQRGRAKSWKVPGRGFMRSQILRIQQQGQNPKREQRPRH
ncbi:minor histocompatibility antigen H13 isoform X1 [Physeter macrocephalus]|uniref:Minor histocompatibility antigen H13 isoform X1 n=1 Tax=Physeter macrocephalus TaxID=9755 RepID=A0A455CAM4_PHYMC|nr:minor histocompatibility antigen H13 isoform X1 [Physeter catodon]|eukprot:XP_028354936.1 minor histocompatibility antigen H13 isoform X1 [Physeter catodon]